MTSTQTAIDSINAQVASRANSREEELRNLSDRELEKIMLIGLHSGKRADRSGKGLYITLENISSVPGEFFDGLAASSILRQRKGEGYVLNILECAEPRTWYDKLRCCFTERLSRIFYR